MFSATAVFTFLIFGLIMGFCLAKLAQSEREKI
jgi:hypothetical protein